MQLPFFDPDKIGVMNALTDINNLTAGNLANEKARIENKYLPITSQAGAASKLAYANLMGPQFLAKIMGNSDILANMTPSQRDAALAKVYQAGSGQGTGASLGSSDLFGTQSSSPNSLLGLLFNKLSSGNNQNQLPMNAISQPNPMSQQSALSPQDQNAIGNLQPGQSYVVQGNQGQSTAVPQQSTAAQTFPENVGAYQGIKEEGKELGKIRAQAIDEMDQQYQTAIQSEVPIQHLMELSQNPAFINMRNKVPFFQDKQLQVLAKIGTPEEQKMIGDYITTTTNAVANTVNGFRGRILDKEITMANQMKISPNDTWNVMQGKLASIGTFNEMTKQRARIASQLMQKEHINRGEALARADKQVDAKSIRNKVESQLNPKPSDEDIKYMAQKYNISESEVKKRLKAKGM
jgi:hypothetical protein